MKRPLWIILVSSLCVACGGSDAVGIAGGSGGNGGAGGSGGSGGASGSGGGSGGGGAGGIGGSGGGSGGCAANQREDAFGNCLDVCLSPGDCPAGSSCHLPTGLCLPDATDPCDPMTCQEGWVCPESGTGPCEPGPGYCAADGDCSFGERCDTGRCVSRVGDLVQTCSSDGDCGILMTCQLGVCVGCIDDLQCLQFGADATCIAGTCVLQDIGPAGECLTKQCPDGTRCNPTNGQCEPTCQDAADCSPGEICAPVINRCMTDPGCETDGDCPGALTCTTALGSGICTGCSDTEPCKTGTQCVFGACLPAPAAGPCDSVTCNTDELCDPLDGSCYPANGTCADDGDCRQGQTCNFLSLCSGCSVDADCRPDQRCLFATCTPPI